MEMSSPSIGKLTEALCKAQSEMKNVEKDGKNPFFKSSYATLDAVWEGCKGPFGKHGLAVFQTTDFYEDKPVLVTTLSHVSGEFVRGRTLLILKEQTAQAMGSAITYARRYGLAAIASICPADDDGEGAMSRQAATSAPKPETQGQELTEEQWNNMDTLICSIDDKAWLNTVAKSFKLSSLDAITQKDYAVVMRALQDKIKSKEKANESRRMA